MRTLVKLVALATALLVALGCGGGGDGAEPGPEVATSKPPEKQIDVEGLTYTEMLEVIPDTSQARGELMLVDLTMVRELFDISLPGEQADDGAVLDYLLELSQLRLGGPFISGMDQYGIQTNATFHRYLGFDARNVDRVAWAMTPPGQLEVVWGSFDPEETEHALQACTECPDHVPQEHRGVSFYSWGEDLAVDTTAVFSPPAFDQLGRGGRIAVQEGRVFRTVRTSDMEDLIDASQGKSRSLADVDEFEQMAKTIETLGAYGAFMSDLTFALSGTEAGLGLTAEQLTAIQENYVPLRPYIAFATGAGKDARGVYMVLVLVHDSERLASENKERLQAIIDEAYSFRTNQPWSEFMDGAEIDTDGSLLRAKLHGERIASIWLNVVFNRDSLLVHE